MSAEWVAILGGWIAVVGGWFVTLRVQGQTGHLNRELHAQAIARQTEDGFFKTLDWLSGQTQNRSLGIAAAEFHWDDLRLRRLLIPVLVRQAIYLSQDSSHIRKSKLEMANLERIMELLLRGTSVDGHRQDYQRLLRVLQAAEEHRDPDHPVSPEELRTWRTAVHTLLKDVQQSTTAI